MKPLNLQHSIRLTFARHAEPDSPIDIDKEATDKIDQLPKLLRALEACYGSRLGIPKMWCGGIYLAICSDDELFDLGDTMASDLAVAAKELHENAQRQPPRPLTQAVTHPHCIDLLRSLAQVYDKSKLTATMHIAGKAMELPHIELADFTEPEVCKDTKRHFRAKLFGVCIPTPEANVILLDDMSLLELPTADYAYSTDELHSLVQTRAAVFVGPAEPVKKCVYRALPGGNLQAQLPL